MHYFQPSPHDHGTLYCDLWQPPPAAPSPDKRVALLMHGPHDGALVPIDPHTHALVMPDHSGYAYDPTLSGKAGGPVFAFERYLQPLPTTP